MATTPTSLIKRLMGTEPCLDGLQLCKAPLLAIPAASTTLTLSPATHAGLILGIASTGGLAITPPAATGTFNVYTFLVTATLTGGSFTFDAKAGNASDLIYGSGFQFKSGTGLTVYSAGSNTNLITLNGTTSGGILGDLIQLIDVATNQWQILQFDTQATGTVISPFSNH